MTNKTQTNKPKVLLGNPYDIEMIFESLSIASDHDKELVFMDRLVALIRHDPTAELTTIVYKILRDLDILKLEKPKANT